MTKEEILDKRLEINRAKDYISDDGRIWKSAIDAMQEYATQEKQGWVSIRDRMPEERQEVMVLISNQHEFAFYKDNKFNKRDWFGAWSGVVYWMPLPQKPEV